MRYLLVALVGLILIAVPARAETPRTLDWEGLIPPAPPLEDPLGHLTNDQKVEIELIYEARWQAKRRFISKVSSQYEQSVEFTEKLTREGLDVEALLNAYEEMGLEIDRRNNEMRKDLDGQLVRIPGFALPLEFSGTAVTELLLVPYVGACIHAPPPPLNQTVYVHLDKGYLADKLYEPIWITGRMAVKSTTRKLSLVDGTADVQAGYSLEGTTIEPYKE